MCSPQTASYHHCERPSTKLNGPLFYFFRIFLAVSITALEMTYQKCREFCVVGNVMSRYVFIFKKQYKKELIQVNLMAPVREELRLNHSTIHAWLHNLQIYEMFSQHNNFSISDLLLLYKILFIFNYKVFRRIPYYLSLYNSPCLSLINGFMLFTVLHIFSSSLCVLHSTTRYLSIKTA